LEELIKRVITKTQSKWEIGVQEKPSKQQGSYNLDLNVMEKLLSNNLIEKKNNLDNDKEIDYCLCNDCKIVLSKNILSVINELLESEVNVIFTHTVAFDGTEKFQIKRTKNNSDEFLWFSLLYDKLVQGAIFIVSMVSEKNEIYFDIDLREVVLKICESLYDTSLDFDNDSSFELESSNGQNSDITYYVSTSGIKPMQRILHGAPGTGKSYTITSIIKEKYPDYENKGNPNVFRLTIYPDYTYSDFVGCIMPVVEYKLNNEKTVSYEFVSGPFVESLKQALNNEGAPTFLVLEEMSRGNISAIFGDLFQLLDRQNGISEYGIYNSLISSAIGFPGKEVKLPNNFNILGSVNTSDQNVFAIDTAFKRRFDYEYISINPVGKLNNFSFILDQKTVSWLDFYQRINDYIIDNLQMSEDKQIGQFFIKFENEPSLLDKVDYKVFCGSLLNYLWNDIHLSSINGKTIFNNSYKKYSDCLTDFLNHRNVLKISLDPIIEKNEN
jgi:hypothetical protein